jgi:hypothetical protein
MLLFRERADARGDARSPESVFSPIDDAPRTRFEAMNKSVPSR